MRLIRFAAAVAIGSISASVVAGPLMLYPVQTGAETVRFMTGVPTLNLETPTGAIQVTPLPFDHGHVTFGLGIYNKGTAAANFGIENITTLLADEQVPVLSSAELQKRAKSRATWSAIGVALLAGAAAGAASTAHTTDHYYGHMRTPHGTYAWSTSYRDNTVGVLGATAAAGAGVAGVVGIQNRLDYTLANLSAEVIQTTTVDPDTSYGGKIIIEKSDKAKVPYDVRVVINWNGSAYPFVFRVTKDGLNVPAPYTTAPASLPVPPVAGAMPAAMTSAGATMIPSTSVLAPFRAAPAATVSPLSVAQSAKTTF